MQGQTIDWFSCEISRPHLKQLMRRDDHHGSRCFVLWLGCLIGSGALAWMSLGSWWAVPAFFIFGSIYCFAEPIAHECAHNTAFRSHRLNESIYFFVTLLLFKERIFHRWMHARHHSHTIISGEDPEIQYPRPTNLWRFFILEPFKILPTFNFVGAMISHAWARPTTEAQKWIPESAHRQLFFWSRVQLLTYVAVGVLIVASNSWTALLFFPAARFYGGLMHTLFATSQHAGLPDNVFDHRLNSRTIILGPVGAFFYWNMNYHLEHHMFPLVPFHALPRCHQLIKAECPPPHQGMLAAYGDILTAFFKQQTDPDFVIVPKLPTATAKADQVGA